MFDFESRVLVSNNEVISTYKASSPFYIGNLAQLLILSTDYSGKSFYFEYEESKTNFQLKIQTTIVFTYPTY